MTRLRSVGRIVLVFLLLSVVMVPAAAQTNTTNSTETAAPLYNDSEPMVDSETWMNDHEDPTLESLIHYFGRVGSFVVGTDASNQVAGPLLVGMLLFGAALGATMGTGVGTTAGGVLAVSGVAAATSLGIAPQWTYPVILFGMGLVLASAIRRYLS